MREFVGEYGKGVRQENVRSKTKELTCTLPYALSMRPSVITASSVDCQDVTTEGSSITLTSEEDNGLCRLANGDPDDEDVGDDEDQTPDDQRAARESEREVSLPRLAGVSLSGRRTTLFQL